MCMWIKCIDIAIVKKKREMAYKNDNINTIFNTKI